MDFYQILAQEGKESFVIKDLLENLIDKTRLIIKKYRDKLKTPLLLDVSGLPKIYNSLKTYCSAYVVILLLT